FFQAEDGIRDWSVTGVQTCALPICYDDQPPATSVTVPLPLRRSLTAAAPASFAAWHGDGHGDDRAPRRSQCCVAARACWDSKAEIGRASCREREKSSVRGVARKKIE